MSYRPLQRITTFAILLAAFVVMLGAYTRLTDAGLGCPDWPGCYGQLVLPNAPAQLHTAQQTFPTLPIEERKAWTEMIHRYAAGTLGLFIMTIAAFTLWRRKKEPHLPFTLPIVLLGLLAFQAALGMWTVTLKLLPVVVMGHLLGGMLILGSLIYFRWQCSSIHVPLQSIKWKRLLNLGVMIVFIQIALGGWVSANYAGIACIGFPTCNGVWLPKLDLSHAFQCMSSLNLNYQGGVLDIGSRITIQMVHRMGALITAGYLLILCVFLMIFNPTSIVKKFAVMVVLCVTLQFTLGILNVVYLLPLSIAVLHNGVAALLFGLTLSLRYLVPKRRSHAC